MSFVVCATNAANYLTFTAEEENSSFNINVSGDDPDVQYSLDEGITWTPLKSFIRVKLENKGDKALLKGDNPSGFSTSNKHHTYFEIEGSIAASGSVMSLIDGNGESDKITGDYCFFNLFYNVFFSIFCLYKGWK